MTNNQIVGVAVTSESTDHYLMLWRHAKTEGESASGRDFDRELTKKGIRAAETIAQWMSNSGHQPQQILCSTTARARQTLQSAIDVLGRSPGSIDVKFLDELYLAPVHTLVESVRSFGTVQKLLVIAHNPGLEQLGWQIPSTIPEIANPIPMSTAALWIARCSIESWAGFEPTQSELLIRVEPSDLSV